MNAQPPTGRSAGCPSPDSMRAFHSGRLPPPEMEALADHLGVCTACAAVFEAMADDPVVSKLRQYLPQPTPALDPECERLAAAARVIPLEPTGAETSLRDTPSYEPRTLAAPPPRRFADYDLLQQLGAGGMGVVWKARHLRLNRLVALKMVRFASAADGPERQRFRREGEAVARVRHPNIVEIYDADEVDGQPYIAMELLEGGTLARRVRDRPLTPREAAGLVRTLALAVQAAHDRGVVHRDLKPTNVLFAADDTPKVADFGLAKLLDAETGQTRTGDVLGTPAYMAPEQARGDAGRIGPRTDVYGLGAMLYELLHGKPPFRGADRKAVLKQVLHGRPESATGKQRGPGQQLATICAKCLEKEPRDRYPSAAALAEDLDRWLDGRAPEAKRPGPLAQTSRFVRRRKFLCASLAACGLGATAGLTGWWWLRPDPDAAIKEIEKRLARGEAVELIGSGPASAPAWSHVVQGTIVTDRSDKGDRSGQIDQAFRLLSYTPPGRLDLVHDPQTDRYVIRAEIRHETDQGFGSVGLYFGRRDYSITAGDVQVLVQTYFNDVHSQGDDFRHWNQDHPEKPQQRVPEANSVRVDLVVPGFGAWAVGPERRRSHLQRTVPTGNAMALDRRQSDAGGGSNGLGGGRSAGAGLSDGAGRRNDPHQPAPDSTAPIPSPAERFRLSIPRGSLGLYAYLGAASFRNVRIEPLRSAD